MRVVTVLLDAKNPELALTVEGVAEDATVQWIKEEICRQDVMGTMVPGSIKLCSLKQPSDALPDSSLLSPALEPLLLLEGAGEEEESEVVVSEKKPSEEAAPGHVADLELAARKAKEDNGRREQVATGLKPAVRTSWQKAWDQGCPSEYTFDVEDPCWVKYLKRHGFCVLADVFPEEDWKTLLADFWSEMAQVVPGLQRCDPSTWTFPGNESTGITRGYGLPHSNFAWAVRSHPQMKRIFELIYRTDQLVVSVDSLKLVGTGVSTPGDFWLHRDQLKDVAPYSIQSIYSFFEVGPYNDGTILIPDSHKEFHHWDEWQKSARGAIVPMLRSSGRQQNNVRIPEDLQERFMARAMKPKVPSNGLILFCSRTIHASSPDAGVRWLREQQTLQPPPAEPRPNRIGVSVSMCPRARRGLHAQQQKIMLMKAQCSTTHWADDEMLRGKTWGRDDHAQATMGFRMLPTPDIERERIRFRWL